MVSLRSFDVFGCLWSVLVTPGTCARTSTALAVAKTTSVVIPTGSLPAAASRPPCPAASAPGRNDAYEHRAKPHQKIANCQSCKNCDCQRTVLFEKRGAALRTLESFQLSLRQRGMSVDALSKCMTWVARATEIQNVAGAASRSE